jgi:hypothetical protein
VSNSSFEPITDEIVQDWLEIARRFGNLASNEKNANERLRLKTRREEALEGVRQRCRMNSYPLTEQELQDLLSKAS